MARRAPSRPVKRAAPPADPGGDAARTGRPDAGALVDVSTRTRKEEAVEMHGLVTEALPNTMFRVRLDTGQEALVHMAGRLRRFRIRINPGDRVTVALSPYDLTRGRITYRDG